MTTMAFQKRINELSEKLDKLRLEANDLMVTGADLKIPGRHHTQIALAGAGLRMAADAVKRLVHD